ncbi:spidroin-2-like [Molothrus ater]|uniref:spidroin-2-like n=1 Tax=Molothrus ater TaxID=84834 RepID=UPI0017490FB4|nr:spidroin-2-like [Molothrus ater]
MKSLLTSFQKLLLSNRFGSGEPELAAAAAAALGPAALPGRGSGAAERGPAAHGHRRGRHGATGERDGQRRLRRAGTAARAGRGARPEQEGPGPAAPPRPSGAAGPGQRPAGRPGSARAAGRAEHSVPPRLQPRRPSTPLAAAPSPGSDAAGPAPAAASRCPSHNGLPVLRTAPPLSDSRRGQSQPPPEELSQSNMGAGLAGRYIREGAEGPQ